MSIVYTEITLRNAIDVAKAAEGAIAEQEIRQTIVKALVDTGAWTLVINEHISEKLGLLTRKTASGTLANGKKQIYSLAGPLEVVWKNRNTNCDALVVPGADEVLLGAIPLEGMDLTVNPRSEEVVGVHGDEAVYRV